MPERLSSTEVRRLNAELKERGLHYCPGCCQAKPIADFYTVRGGRISGRCRPCTVSETYRYREQNPGFHQQYMQQWHLNKMAEVQGDPEAYRAYREAKNAAQHAYAQRRRAAKAGAYRWQMVLAALIAGLLAALEAHEAAAIEQQRAARLAAAAAEVAAVCEQFRERQSRIALVRERHLLALERMKRNDPARYRAYIDKLRARAIRRAQRSLAFKGMFNHD